MARHFLQLPRARKLSTASFALAQELVREAANSRSMVVVHGPAGSGKTYATEAAVEQLGGEDTHWVVFPSRATQKRVVKQLLRTVTGMPHEADRYELIDRAIEVLSERPRLLVIDEAQELSWDAIELLRHLWDEPSTEFGLVLAGADGCWELISKYGPLESRIHRRVAFSGLSRGEVLELMPNYHPLYARTPPEVIAFVEDNFAHGNLRAWARFTHDAERLCEQRGLTKLDMELATGVFMLQRSAAAAPATPRRARPGRKTRGARP